MARASGKGQDFERAFCKELSLWWTNQKRDDVFWRTAGSGARATVRAKAHKKTSTGHGDITFIDPIGKPLIDLITFELKRGYSTANLMDVVERTATNAIGIWEGWLWQATRSAQSGGTPFWVICTKRNLREQMVYMNEPFKMALQAEGLFQRRARPSISFVTTARLPNKTEIAVSVFGVRHRQFFTHVTPAHIQALHARYCTPGDG